MHFITGQIAAHPSQYIIEKRAEIQKKILLNRKVNLLVELNNFIKLREINLWCVHLITKIDYKRN